MALAAIANTAVASPPPHLERHGTATQLIVDGHALIMRGGELGNSAGEPDYLRSFWPKLQQLHLNTVLVPAYWDQIEPTEGTFDFRTIDGVIADARAADMHLVFLWFGAWKNSMSCYAPAWVKRDPARFPRCQDSAGRGLEILSPFIATNRDTDARAFAALMRHLRESDGERHTVVMIQVENEIGMIPEARDHSEPADRAFAGPVPPDLLAYLARHVDALAPELRQAWIANGRKVAGTWTQVFGEGAATEEIFMAWFFARYVDEVAKRGKAEYPLPMYVNAALIRPGHQPGQYPSAGPLPQVFDVWHAAAPTIDLLSPDIYFQNYTEWLRRYARAGNPVFVPEMRASPEAGVLALFTLGGQDAMGFSPFAIESINEPTAHWLAEAYDVVDQLTPLLVEHQGTGTIVGLVSEGAEQRQPQRVLLGDYVLLVSFERAATTMQAEGGPGVASGPPTSPAGGLVIALGPDDFLFAGVGTTATFQSRHGSDLAGIETVESGRFIAGKWTHLRFLNGDETNQGRHLRIPPGDFALQRVKLYRYR